MNDPRQFVPNIGEPEVVAAALQRAAAEWGKSLSEDEAFIYASAAIFATRRLDADAVR